MGSNIEYFTSLHNIIEVFSKSEEKITTINNLIAYYLYRTRKAGEQTTPLIPPAVAGQALFKGGTDLYHPAQRETSIERRESSIQHPVSSSIQHHFLLLILFSMDI